MRILLGKFRFQAAAWPWLHLELVQKTRGEELDGIDILLDRDLALGHLAQLWGWGFWKLGPDSMLCSLNKLRARPGQETRFLWAVLACLGPPVESAVFCPES